MARRVCRQLAVTLGCWEAGALALAPELKSRCGQSPSVSL